MRNKIIAAVFLAITVVEIILFWAYLDIAPAIMFTVGSILIANGFLDTLIVNDDWEDK